MIWKISIYLLFIALPTWVVTETFTMNETEETEEVVTVNNNEAPTDGAILGSVIAPDADIIIQGSNGNDIITGETNELGEFFIKGFEEEGFYTITIQAIKDTKVASHTFKEVEIRMGEVTALGTVDLSEEEKQKDMMGEPLLTVQ
ncbi:MAG: hypothetical protein MK211_06490 [Flavobacteriales bacterium]|jgi:hypothetical protein|uniref:hypothetical protein n=1 Tax=Candidatus Ulvibacter alkanivorans TaxID=2267620 RepID=UPI000DF24DBF|nr:hypothetical protein [Candidatus Ulvibacter alkanivorans]MCH2489781.1 hypothetical protein [Flavobacteriales bacterium]